MEKEEVPNDEPLVDEIVEEPQLSESEEDESTEQVEEEEEEEVERETRKYEIIVIKTPVDSRVGSDILNIFEATELVNNRITQINEGHEVFVDVKDLTDATSMAQRELAARRCPLMVQRLMRERIDKPAAKIYRYVEDWDPNKMIHSVTYDV
jgi:DNA-directed RNA polymerase subunit K/omega